MRRFWLAFLMSVALVRPVVGQESGAQSPMAAAFEAIDSEDWDTAYALVAAQGDVAKDLITWARLRAGVGVFADYPIFLAKRPDWPGLDRLRSEGEILASTDATLQDVLAYFDGNDVETGQGAVAYANALIAMGQPEQARALIVHVWQTMGLTDDGFRAIMAAYPDVVLPHHMARAEMLLWRWRTSDTANLLPHLDEGERALVRARMGYIENASDAAERLALVPQRFQNDPGLAYDRFSRLSDAGSWTEAVALLLEQSTSADALGVPWRWGSWRRTLARWQMREGNAEVAYELASQHFIGADETNFSDLEWLSGYLALTYLNEPIRALQHFDRFEKSVSSPISLARAGYWTGRAHQALGNEAEAAAAFAKGAQHQTAFYGLLSAQELGIELAPEIAGGAAASQPADGDLRTNDKVEAGLMLLSAGERGLAVLFLADAAKELDREGLAKLGALLIDMDEHFFAVLVAKAAVRRGIVLHDIYFPIHGLAKMDLPVEPALALAIARQESEFRADAGSSVGALGLMQLMPGTARDVAGELGLSYQRARLTSDWEYNATLGSRYLANLQDSFGDSPVLIAVGYNAGPGRVRDWISERGDPRRGQMDVIDWIEHIPFRETRNYVMRVTEGIPVYRARLTGQTGPLDFREMLIGTPPVVRPRARPEPVEAEAEVAPTLPPVRRGGSLGPSTPQAPQGIRPIARPGG